MSPNFAVRWFELDPTFLVMRAMHWVGIIDMGKKPQVGRWEPAKPRIEAASLNTGRQAGDMSPSRETATSG
jgi:hypothetical protein